MFTDLQESGRVLGDARPVSTTSADRILIMAARGAGGGFLLFHDIPTLPPATDIPYK